METLVKNRLVASYARSGNPNGTLVIVAIGAPNAVDIDSLRNADLLTAAGYDVLVPDYYGFARSGGRFTPQNSIKTLLDARKYAMGGEWTVAYSGESKILEYSNIVFLGLSYGGGVVPLLPKFCPEIDTIGLFYPVTDYRSFGKRGVKEETVEDFLRALKTGFRPLYRGIDDPVWTRQFDDALRLTPMLETAYLKNVRVFLAHGTEDESIYYKKTAEYAAKLRSEFPRNDIEYREYPGLQHGFSTMLPATEDFIRFLSRSASDVTSERFSI